MTSGVDTLTIDCSSGVTVTTSDTPSTPSPSVGGSSGGSSFDKTTPEIPTEVTPSSEAPSSDINVPQKLDSAPEPKPLPIKKNDQPKSPPMPRVKIKTQVRLTLRDDRGVVLTNESIPAPPRADNLPLFDVISELSGINMSVVNG